MPPWLSIALPIVMPVLAVAAAAVINLKIRFAPSRDAAAQELKLLALRVGQWIFNLSAVGFIGYNLFLQVSSSEPLTRAAVFAIAVGVAGLMFLGIMSIISSERKYLYGHIADVYRNINKHNDGIITLAETVTMAAENITLANQLSELRLKEHQIKSSLSNGNKAP